MTKQEIIKAGILKRLNEFRWELQKPNALLNLDTLTTLQGAFADQILKDEDSQGVVIRVDPRERNDLEMQEMIEGPNGGLHPRWVLLEAQGHKFYEPLIEEKKNE